jgi:iron-sulfur cluster assembly accessory protein
MLPNIAITAAAEKFIGRILRLSGLAGSAGFRLAVSPGGCSGYSSEFSAEPAPQAGEETLTLNGMRFFLSAPSRLMLQGVTIDFTESATQSGLSFINPNQAACACSSAGTTPLPGVTRINVSAIGRARPAAPSLAP